MKFTLSTRSAQLKIFLLVISLAVLATLVPAFAFEETRMTPAQQRHDECTEAAELRVLLSRDLTTIAFPGIPTTISGTKSALVKSGNCPTVHHTDSRLSSFAWKLETPPGSTARLQDTTTLTVRFTPIGSASTS